MKEIKRYAVILRFQDEPMYISKEGGAELMELLKDNPPMFIPIKDSLVARMEIKQVVPLYV
jgi:hypothetical protein